MRNAYDLDDVTQPRIPGCNPQSSVGNVHGNGFRPQAGVFAHTFSLAQHGVCGNTMLQMAAIYSGADAVRAAAPFLCTPEGGSFLEQFL